MGAKTRQLTPLGVAIKKALVERNMTQVQLAERLHVSSKYISLILYGERSGEKYISKIATILDIELERFQKSA